LLRENKVCVRYVFVSVHATLYDIPGYSRKFWTATCSRRLR